MSDLDLVAVVAARLETRLPDLAGRVQDAADFARLVQKGELPQRTPAAWVLSSGDAGDTPAWSTAGFVQWLTEEITVVIVERVAGDGGTRTRSLLQPWREAVRGALCGWTPGPGYEPITWRRGRLVPMGASGALAEQIEVQTRRRLDVRT